MVHPRSQAAVTGEVRVITMNVSFLLSSGEPVKHSKPHAVLMSLTEAAGNIDLEVIKSCSWVISQE